MTAPFEPGERVLLIDQRDRRYLVKALVPGELWHSHGGAIEHDLIIGRAEGTRVRTGSGMVFTCFRPTLADFVLKMPRGAQVVYPKDLGAILVWADIHPGAKVLEAGTGSGAVTIGLCRAVGAEGRVVSYELREDFHATAAANVEAFFGKVPPQLDLRRGDLAEVAATGERFDRVVLDLPEPWPLLGPIDRVLDPGGVTCGYVPTTIQAQELVLAMQRAGYEQIETFEVLHRSWHVTARSVRPDHRMIAHTGFITVGRKTVAEPISDEPVPDEPPPAPPSYP
jgi:tRNA (adenine57-N1/adenine58-N1)-methyltransferase catalytic subunit